MKISSHIDLKYLESSTILLHSLFIPRRSQESLFLRFGNNALSMTVNDLYDHSHYISVHVDREDRQGKRYREGEKR